MSICNLSTTQIVFFRTVWDPTALAVSGCQEIKLDLSCKTNDENLFFNKRRLQYSTIFSCFFGLRGSFNPAILSIVNAGIDIHLPLKQWDSK